MAQFPILISAFLPIKKGGPSNNEKRHQAPVSFARRYLNDDGRKFSLSIGTISTCFLLLMSKDHLPANALCIPPQKHLVSRIDVSKSYSYSKSHSQTRRILHKKSRGNIKLYSLKESEIAPIAIQRRSNNTESVEHQLLLNSPTHANGHNLIPKNGKKLEETNGKLVPSMLKSTVSNFKFESNTKNASNLSGETVIKNVTNDTKIGSKLIREGYKLSINPDSSQEKTIRNNNKPKLKSERKKWKPFSNYTTELKSSYKNLWERRYARTIDEGIRFEKISLNDPELPTKQNSSQIPFLSNILNSAHKVQRKKRYAARTITGLLVALAEESSGLQVEVDARRDTPMSGKQIDSITINFSRLGFAPLRMNGLHKAYQDFERNISPESEKQFMESLSSSKVTTAEEAFNRIDVDSSGALDADELAQALDMAMDTHSKDLQSAGLISPPKKIPKRVLTGLASRLVSLYDTNGDMELDREEYQSMVKDMAILRNAHANKVKKSKNDSKNRESGFFNKVFLKKNGNNNNDNMSSDEILFGSETMEQEQIKFESAIDVSDSEDTILSSVTGEGSIVLSDLKVDLRRLLFGAVPIVKKVTPGGPLVLEPFTMTVSGSFKASDVMDSFLLNQGLRLLVARVLRRQVRSFRDLVDGAVFFGRTWNMNSKSAPVVEEPIISKIEFDEKDRAIISGRVAVQSSPGTPFIENAFKLRTRIGTRENGQVIRLKNPELALVVECPKAWERNIVSACKNLNLPIPRRPKPIYTYIPLVSPLKKSDKDGYNMGEDNCIKSIDIKDGALHVVMSAVIRPGRFLGNHYLAFTVPNRSVIITMDRVKNGIRVARRNKREADEALKIAQKEAIANKVINEKGDFNDEDKKNIQNAQKDTNIIKNDSLEFIDPEKPNNEQKNSSSQINESKGFFNRFMQGYINAVESDRNIEERTARLSSEISEWFGRQSLSGYFTDEDS